MNRLLRSFALGLLALMLAGSPARAQTHLVVAAESRLWIEGTSTAQPFSCEADALEGYGVLAEGAAEAVLSVPVRAFDCGKRRMNADLYAALRAEVHPLIRFRLEAAHLDEAAPVAFRLHVAGWLTLAGVQRRVEVPVHAVRRADGRFRAEGKMPLQMTAFGIDPPTALLGLVRAHDAIVVRFDLVAQPTMPFSTR